MSTSQAHLTRTAELFRDAFRAHPAGISVITAQGVNGPVGLTVSSVSSVSANPPVVAFSVLMQSSAAITLQQIDAVVVHLLDADQVAVAKLFSAKGADRFGGDVPWRPLPTGEPLLVDAGWALRCRVLHRFTVGESTVFVAAVLSVQENETVGPALVYQNRAYHRLDGRSLLR